MTECISYIHDDDDDGGGGGDGDGGGDGEDEDDVREGQLQAAGDRGEVVT